VLDTLTDADLVAKHLVAGGDGATVWLQELFRRHYTKVATWCLRIAGNRDDALDLAQAVFVKAQRHLRSFRGESKVSTWLYSIAKRECLNHLKSRSSLTLVLDDELAGGLPGDPGSDPEDLMERERSINLVRSLLDHELDETERLVFTMHYGDDMPLEAITRLLGLGNRSGAKAFIVSARRKLGRAVIRWKAGQERLNA